MISSMWSGRLLVLLFAILQVHGMTYVNHLDGTEAIKNIPYCYSNHRIYPFKVSVGDGTKISCNIRNSGERFVWRRRNGKPLPNNITSSGGDLFIAYTEESAAGIYDCFKQQKNECIVISTNLIVDRPVSKDPLTAPVVPLNTIVLVYVNPSESQLYPGQSATISCKTSSLDCQITWERANGQKLPPNFYPQGNELNITNFNTNDAGQYVCMCKTSDHRRFGRKFDLNVLNVEIKPTEIKEVKVGSDVSLICDRERSADKYNWKRTQGRFKIGTNIINNVLQLRNIQQDDSGTYICTQTHGIRSSYFQFDLKVVN